jgi:hypothetical protein
MKKKKSKNGTRVEDLLKIIQEEGLHSRDDILSKTVLERVIRSDHAFMRGGATQDRISKEIRNFRKLCKNPRSIPFRRIFKGKR